MLDTYFRGLCFVILIGRVTGDDTNRPVNINHFSVGGSPSILTSLNHLNMQTLVLLNTRFSHENAITSWQFYAESTMPFYPSIWKITGQSGRTFTVKLIDYNRVVPIKTGYQEIKIPPANQIWSSVGDVLGIFYAVEDQPPDLVLGTVPIETYAKEPTDGVTDDMVTSVVDSTPRTPLEKGYKFTAKAGNKTARLLAMRAVYEPDFNHRAIPVAIQEKYGVRAVNASIPEFNVGRIWGTICDEGARNTALAWGDQACKRIYRDPDFAMVTSFKVNITNFHVNVPVAAPLIFNPTCSAEDDQLFAEGCVSSSTCDLTSPRALVCAHTADVPKLKDNIQEDADAWNFLA